MQEKNNNAPDTNIGPQQISMLIIPSQPTLPLSLKNPALQHLLMNITAATLLNLRLHKKPNC